MHPIKRFLNIRLSYIYPILFIIFMIVLVFFKRLSLTPGQLALFSVNSFLFGYYFGPILAAQKTRVDTMNKTVRAEVMVLLDVLTQSHLLEPKVRLQLKERVQKYIDSILDNPKIRAENEYYDELLYFVTQDKFKDNPVMKTVYDRISKTQEDRDTLNSLYSAKLFSHEWLVLLVLYSVTLFFVLQINYGNVILFQALAAILCTGLTLLIVIVAKYNALTHKQAKQLWVPLRILRKEHFEDIK